MVLPVTPIVAVVIAVILIIIGLKIAKWVFWSLAIIVVIGGFAYFFMYSPAEPTIGGQTDEHDCLIGAGYSWCETKQKCLRTWEELCPESFCETNNTVQICDNYVKVISPLVGSGATYYKEDLTGNRTEFTCPVVAPDAMTPECKQVFNMSCGENIC